MTSGGKWPKGLRTGSLRAFDRRIVRSSRISHFRVRGGSFCPTPPLHHDEGGWDRHPGAGYECGHVVPSSTHAFHRSSGSYAGQPRSTEVKLGQWPLPTFLILRLCKVIRGADFDSDIHFTLSWLEMRLWNQPVIKGQWRHMTRKWFCEFFTPKNHRRAIKTIKTCSTGRKELAVRWNFTVAPLETKVSAITSFRDFLALDLTSEVTRWPRTLSLHTTRFVSRRATRSFLSAKL